MGYAFDDVEVVKATMDMKGRTKALLLRCDDLDAEYFGGEGEWVPYSAVHDDSGIYREGEIGTVVLKTWFCEKKGWTGD